MRIEAGRSYVFAEILKWKHMWNGSNSYSSSFWARSRTYHYLGWEAGKSDKLQMNIMGVRLDNNVLTCRLFEYQSWLNNSTGSLFYLEDIGSI